MVTTAAAAAAAAVTVKKEEEEESVRRSRDSPEEEFGTLAGATVEWRWSEMTTLPSRRDRHVTCACMWTCGVEYPCFEYSWQG